MKRFIPFDRMLVAGISTAVVAWPLGRDHQPFQEISGQFNARVDAVWREVEARA